MIAFSAAVISDRLQALTRALDLDPIQNGKLLIYAGTQPVTGGTPSGALLGTLTFFRPSLSGVTGATLTLRNPPASLAVATGTASWARMVNGADQFVADLTLGLPGSGAAVELVTPTSGLILYAGGELSVSVARLVEV
jgi:hypothetical protein